MKKEMKHSIGYICDQKKCERCSAPQCTHTLDIRHAKNFMVFYTCEGEVVGAYEVAKEMINERQLREKVFAVAWDMWVDEGSPGYCRAILSIYAKLTNQDLDEVEKEWDKATEGLTFDSETLSWEQYIDKGISHESQAQERRK